MCATVWPKKLGYDNFIELGYCRMNRLCYGAAGGRGRSGENVLRDIVPAVSAPAARKTQSVMGIEDVSSSTITKFSSPAATRRPCGKDGMFAAAREMYHAMSQETGRVYPT